MNARPKYIQPDFAAIPVELNRIGKPPLLFPGTPMESAQIFLARHFNTVGILTLRHHDGSWRVWTGTHYSACDEPAIRAQLYHFLDNARTLDQDREEPFRPNMAKVNNVVDALKACVNIPTSVVMPQWLDYSHCICPPASEMIACRNGLLHLPTSTLHPHNPIFFNAHALEFDFDPMAPPPAHWLAFLHSLWGGNPEAISVLQEFFGLFLTADTRYQKILMVIGPPRSGKGTIARVLTALLGKDAVCGPTLAGMSTNFGLQPMIGKNLAIIADVRLGRRADQAVITERLLSISGEDTLTIDRKFLLAWTGRLPTRLMMMTNEYPKLADGSGALASRFIILTMGTSFLGREDHGLEQRLLGELPGILLWAIDGWRRLKQRGYLVRPRTSVEAAAEFEAISSPIKAFVRERCRVAPGLRIACSDLYDAWVDWCVAHDRDPGTTQAFGRDSRAAVPSVGSTQPRGEDGGRPRFYEGIGSCGDRVGGGGDGA